MNLNGWQRPKSASKGYFDPEWQIEGSPTGFAASLPATISYSGIPATPRAVAGYLDMEDDSIRVVCGGTVRVIGTQVGVLAYDTRDGETGMFVNSCIVRLPVLATDTLAIGGTLYWDATNYRLTTTASGNTKAGYLLPFDNISTDSYTISTPAIGEPYAAKWVRIQLLPN